MVKNCVERGNIVQGTTDSNNFFHVIDGDTVLFPHVDSCAALMIKTRAGGYYVYHSLAIDDSDKQKTLYYWKALKSMLDEHSPSGEIERTVMIACDAWDVVVNVDQDENEREDVDVDVYLGIGKVEKCLYSVSVDIELDTRGNLLRIREWTTLEKKKAWSSWISFLTFSSTDRPPPSL